MYKDLKVSTESAWVILADKFFHFQITARKIATVLIGVDVS